MAVWCRDCVACNRAKITRHVQAPVQQMEVPSRRFSHIHVDLVGLLPVSKDGFSHLFTVVDRPTRWPEAIPPCATTTEDCVEALISGWVARFGMPAAIMSDRGVQFSSGVWAGLCQMLGISHHPTTAYHPQSNGMVERFHRQLKDALRARLQGQDWVSQLPWVLLGLRAAPKEKANISSAEMVYGTALTLPGEFLDSPEAEVGGEVEVRGCLFLPAYDGHRAGDGGCRDPTPAAVLPTHVHDGSWPPLAAKYDSPFLVVAKVAKYFRIQKGNRVESMSVDRLKPHLGTGPVAPASPLARGRPRKAAQKDKDVLQD